MKKEFEDLVLNLLQDKLVNGNLTILHGLLGLSSEVGEVTDLYKKHMFYGKPLDVLKVKEELGDLLHYFQMIVGNMNSSIDEIIDINIAKLKTRYPNGYTHKNAIVRDKDAEYRVMKKVEKQYNAN